MKRISPTTKEKSVPSIRSRAKCESFIPIVTSSITHRQNTMTSWVNSRYLRGVGWVWRTLTVGSGMVRVIPFSGARTNSYHLGVVRRVDLCSPGGFRRRVSGGHSLQPLCDRCFGLDADDAFHFFAAFEHQ